MVDFPDRLADEQIDTYVALMDVAGQLRGKAALVVDDVADLATWTVRGIEIRGSAEALSDVEPPTPYFSAEFIRIHPDRIIAWGLD